jgi:aldose 1-epimerase
MVIGPRPASPIADALAPLAPGPTIRIGTEFLAVTIAPEAGGRIAQIQHRGADQLVGFSPSSAATIAWGCYPMVPWAGRIRRGEFRFQGTHYKLPPNLGPHAIHGVGFGLPWEVESHSAACLALWLNLPQDAGWPFGGRVRHTLSVDGHTLRQTLTLTADDAAMPACIGWHPWFRKPQHLDFAPSAMYPRDHDGIATLPTSAPTEGPWDDCFVNTRPIRIRLAESHIRLTSDCTHWVVYDAAAHATCVEPQTGPADAFTLLPSILQPRQSLSAWFEMTWSSVE